MEKVIIYFLITLKVLSLNINNKELEKIGKLIYMNEARGKVEDLIVWNEGEEFPSLGIGHFIWYPKGYEGPFEESFPKLKEEFIKEKIKLPDVFKTKDSPWKSRKEFLDKKNNDNKYILEGINFLNNNKNTQLIYISRRLGRAIPLIIEKAQDKNHIKKVLYELLKEPFAMYPLLDYVNFKGEGIKEEERYNGKGWGLLQVLENIEIKEDMVEAFEKSAKEILKRRIDNSPKSRNESRWLEGWDNRMDTYIKERDKFLLEKYE